jgi:hypothetical protein
MAEHAMSHGHASADDEYRETPPGAGHEHTDADVWLIVKFGLWLFVAAVVVHLGLGALFALFVRQREVTTEPEFPLAIGQELRLPAEPRLQRFPANEIYEFRRREEAILQNYGWVDRNAGIVHIPIEEAMRLTVERGLPARAAAAAPAAEATSGGPAAASGAVEPVELMPSDASSGRMLERRR